MRLRDLFGLQNFNIMKVSLPSLAFGLGINTIITSSIELFSIFVNNDINRELLNGSDYYKYIVFTIVTSLVLMLSWANKTSIKLSRLALLFTILQVFIPLFAYSLTEIIHHGLHVLMIPGFTFLLIASSRGYKHGH